MNNGDVLNAVLNNAVQNVKRREGDYVKDGILICGKCGEPRQAWIDWMPEADGKQKQRLVPVVCRCDKQEDAENAERDRENRFRANLRQMRDAVGAEKASWTFADDDNSSGSISRALRTYAEKWDTMKRENMGILLYGSNGTGKSFYASCLVNAIEEQKQTSAFVVTASLMTALQGTWERREIIDTLCRFKFLALDDFGAERDTSFGMEQMYAVIDARYRAKLPTLITTNLDMWDMLSETDLYKKRIYDRVIEMCPITIDMQRESRRVKLADERKQKAREILKG